MRILYLQTLPFGNGRGELRGRDLVSHLAERFEVHVGSCINDDLEPKNPRNVMRSAEFLDSRFDVVIVEGGIQLSPGSQDPSWRFPVDTVQPWIESGGVLIVADVDVNDARGCPEAYSSERLLPLFGAVIDYGSDGKDSPLQGIDTAHHFGSSPYAVECLPDRMLIAEWLRPIYASIDALGVWAPVSLQGRWGSEPLATGNHGSSETIRSDVFVDDLPCLPFVFGTVRQHQLGHAVLVAGNMTHDGILGYAPDNARWFITVIGHLVDETGRHRNRLHPPRTEGVRPEPVGASTQVGAWKNEIRERHERIELRLREVVLERYSTCLSEADAVADLIARHVKDGMRRETVVSGQTPEAMLGKTLWTELCAMVWGKKWSWFQTIFGDKTKFKEMAERLNYRPYAHPKPLDEEGYRDQRYALEWFEKRLEV